MAFLWSDAWILQSIAIAAETTPADLTAIIAAADSVNHALPTNDELRGGLRRLVDAGHVDDTKGRFRVSSQVPKTTVSAMCGKNSRIGRDAAAAFLNAEEWTPGSNAGDPRNGVGYPGVTDEVLRNANDQYFGRYRHASKARRGRPAS